MEDIRDVREAIEDLGLPAVGEVLHAVDELRQGLTWGDVFDALTNAKEAVEHLEREAVRWARLEGETWETIGAHLGLSRQGAQKRYASSDLKELDALDELHTAELEALMSEMKLAAAREKWERGDALAQEPDEATRVDLVADPVWLERLMRLMHEHQQRRRALLANIKGG